MKIERAIVEESISPSGIYMKPKLTLELDVRSLPKSTPAGVSRGGSIQVYGKRFSFLADLHVVGQEDNVSDHINNFYPGRPWFPVQVNHLNAEYQWYIPLDRARKELARHQNDWRIVTDDAAVVQGDLVWRLQEKSLTCRARGEHYTVPDVLFCGAPASTEIRRLDYYIPLCDVHLTELIKSRGNRR
jgi:hypothetical protein